MIRPAQSPAALPPTAPSRRAASAWHPALPRALRHAQPGGAAASDHVYGRPFWHAYASNLLAMVGIALLYRYADFVTVLGGEEFELGWIVGIGMIGSLAVRLTIGTAIDRRGTRLIWLGSTVLFGAVCCAHLAVDTCHGPAIYALRLLYCCAMAGIFGASMTFVSARAPAVRIGELVGMLGTSGYIGAWLGTQLGDWLLDGQVTRPAVDQMFLIAGVFGFASVVFAHLATRRQPALRPPAERLPLWQTLRRFHPGSVFAVGVAAGMALVLLTAFLRAFTVERGIGGMGAFFAVYALSAVVTRVVTRRWVERFGSEPIVLAGLLGLALALVLLLPASVEWHLVASGLCFGFAQAVLFPSIMAAGTRRFPDAHRGLGTTLILSSWDVGQLVGAPAAGAILWYSDSIGLPSYPTLFLATAVMLLAVAGYYAAVSWGRAAAGQRQPAVEAVSDA